MDTVKEVRLFQRQPPSRGQLLEKAGKARARRKTKKALALYQKALALDPNDHETLARMAPLLARRGQPDEAWDSFTRAASLFQQRGFLEKATGVYRQAATSLPRRPIAWEALAQVNLDRNRPHEARGVLLEGSRHFFRRADRAEAIRLLRQAFELDPWHYDVTYTLAWCLLKNGDTNEAIELLEELATRVRKRRLRRLRGLIFRASPGFGPFLYWLRALLLGR